MANLHSLSSYGGVALENAFEERGMANLHSLSSYGGVALENAFEERGMANLHSLSLLRCSLPLAFAWSIREVALREQYH
jgi:hypothetical protein